MTQPFKMEPAGAPETSSRAVWQPINPKILFQQILRFLKVVSLDGQIPNRLCSRFSVLKFLSLKIHICHQQSHYRPEVSIGFQEGKVRMAQNGGQVVSLYNFFTPRKYSWYPFLSEAESTPGP